MHIDPPHSEQRSVASALLASPSKPDPSPGEPWPPVALCLSGGGKRAALFHLGLIRALVDCGMLPATQTICSVSGGSITAAHLVAHWDAYRSRDSFPEVAAQLIDFAGRDTSGFIVATEPVRALIRAALWFPAVFSRRIADLRLSYTTLRILDLRLRPLFLGSSERRNSRMRRWCETWLGFRTRRDTDLTLSAVLQGEGPDLHILATNLNRPSLASFSAAGLCLAVPPRPADGAAAAPGKLKFVLPERIEISTAIAASAAFPGVFPPLRISRDEYGLTPHEAPDEVLYLADAGAVDNLGLSVLECLSASKLADGTEILVSDATGHVQWSDSAWLRTVVGGLWRTIDVLTRSARDHAIERKQAASTTRTLISIEDRIARGDRHFDEHVPEELQGKLKELRTELDAFTHDEVNLLVAHGQLLGRRAIDGIRERRGMPRFDWSARPLWLPHARSKRRVDPRSRSLAKGADKKVLRRRPLLAALALYVVAGAALVRWVGPALNAHTVEVARYAVLKRFDRNAAAACRATFVEEVKWTPSLREFEALEQRVTTAAENGADLTADQRAALALGSYQVVAEEPRTIDQVHVYLDTPEHRLRSLNCALYLVLETVDANLGSYRCAWRWSQLERPGAVPSIGWDYERIAQDWMAVSLAGTRAAGDVVRGALATMRMRVPRRIENRLRRKSFEVPELDAVIVLVSHKRQFVFALEDDEERIDLQFTRVASWDFETAFPDQAERIDDVWNRLALPYSADRTRWSEVEVERRAGDLPERDLGLSKQIQCAGSPWCTLPADQFALSKYQKAAHYLDPEVERRTLAEVDNFVDGMFPDDPTYEPIAKLKSNVRTFLAKLCDARPLNPY